MNIQQVFEVIGFRIQDSSKYLYNCYGNNSIRGFEFSTIEEQPCGAFVADASGKVYEITVEVPAKNICYRWIDPEFKQALFDETKAKGFDPKFAWDDVAYFDLELEEDILSKTKAICNLQEFDSRIMVPLDLDTESFNHIAKLAHERDITFNEMVGLIIQSLISEIKQITENETSKEGCQSKSDCCGGCDKPHIDQEAEFDSEFDKLISKKKTFSTF